MMRELARDPQKPKAKKAMKSSRLDLLISPQLKQKLHEHADSLGVSVSHYIIGLIQKDLNLNPKEYR